MNRYTLSDSDILGINEAIDSCQNGSDLIYNGIVATWNAILGQEGNNFSSYVEAHGTIDPMLFAIPEDQFQQVMGRMKMRAIEIGLSDIGVTNVLLDCINYGPSTYRDAPATDSDVIELTDFPYVVHKPHNNDGWSTEEKDGTFSNVNIPNGWVPDNQ